MKVKTRNKMIFSLVVQIEMRTKLSTWARGVADSVGRAVASNTIGLGFISNHKLNFIINISFV